MLHITAVVPVLLNQVASVGGRINQNVIRSCLHTAFNHCLQELILNLKLLKRQIIHINNKTIISVLNLGNHRRQILKLVFINLDHPKSLIVEFVDNRLDACRFSRTTVSKKKNIVGLLSLYKCKCILYQLFLLQLISNQIIQHNGIHIIDCHKINPTVCSRLNAKGFIQSKHSHAVILVKSGYTIKEFVFILCFLQPPAQSLYLLADIFIIHQFFFSNSLIIGNPAETVDPQIFLQSRKVIME